MTPLLLSLACASKSTDTAVQQMQPASEPEVLTDPDTAVAEPSDSAEPENPLPETEPLRYWVWDLPLDGPLILRAVCVLICIYELRPRVAWMHRRDLSATTSGVTHNVWPR